MCKHAMPLLRAAKGTIVNINSIQAFGAPLLSPDRIGTDGAGTYPGAIAARNEGRLARGPVHHVTKGVSQTFRDVGWQSFAGRLPVLVCNL